MSFASCTGTTRETCQPPCTLIYNADTQGAVCVPPLPALSASLSDADIDRIRALIGTGGLAPSANTAELALSLRALHADLRVYVDNRIRRHMNNTTQTDWHAIVRDIMAELLNDTRDLVCVVCMNELDDSEPVVTIECIHPQSRAYTPIHTRCTRDLLHRGHSCPICQRPFHTNHGDGVFRAWRIGDYVDRVVNADRLRREAERRDDRADARAGQFDGRQQYVVEFPGIMRRIVGPALLVGVLVYLAALILQTFIGTTGSDARPTIDTRRLPDERSLTWLDSVRLPLDCAIPGRACPIRPGRQLVATDARSLPWLDPNAMPRGYAVGDLTDNDFELGFDGRWYLITDYGGRPMTDDTPLTTQK